MDWSNRFNFGGFFVNYWTFQIPWEVIEKKVDPGGALQICKIQKLCRIGKSWKPLKKPEAGEVVTFVLKRIRIQQRFRFATKIGTVCFGLFKPNRTIAPAEYSLPFLKSENHLRNPLKQ